MELKDTVELMNSNDYKDRFRAEYYQLAIRRRKLAVMLRKWKENELSFEPTCSYEILSEQLVYMNKYLVALETRAMIEGIELKMTAEAGE